MGRARDMYPPQSNPLRAAHTHPFLSHILIRLYPPSPVAFPFHPIHAPLPRAPGSSPRRLVSSRLVRAPQRLQRLRPLPKP
jgi:hypothetical protein